MKNNYGIIAILHFALKDNLLTCETGEDVPVTCQVTDIGHALADLYTYADENMPILFHPRRIGNVQTVRKALDCLAEGKDAEQIYDVMKKMASAKTYMDDRPDDEFRKEVHHIVSKLGIRVIVEECQDQHNPI